MYMAKLQGAHTPVPHSCMATPMTVRDRPMVGMAIESHVADRFVSVLQPVTQMFPCLYCSYSEDIFTVQRDIN